MYRTQRWNIDLYTSVSASSIEYQPIGLYQCNCQWYSPSVACTVWVARLYYNKSLSHHPPVCHVICYHFLCHWHSPVLTTTCWYHYGTIYAQVLDDRNFAPCSRCITVSGRIFIFKLKLVSHRQLLSWWWWWRQSHNSLPWTALQANPSGEAGLLELL